jgi:hypothetical protein
MKSAQTKAYLFRANWRKHAKQPRINDPPERREKRTTKARRAQRRTKEEKEEKYPGAQGNDPSERRAQRRMERGRTQIWRIGADEELSRYLPLISHPDWPLNLRPSAIRQRLQKGPAVSLCQHARIENDDATLIALRPNQPAESLL